MTDDLVALLSRDLKPVKRLRPPLIRAVGWIAFACLIIALLVYLRGLRGDFASHMWAPGYWVQIGGAWLMGASATAAAFNISLPDRSSLWMLAPIPAACLWVTGFAYGCLGDWVAIPFGATVVSDSIGCLETICMASTALGLILWLMLRKARPLRPAPTAWLGGLAIVGFADTAHLLIHEVEASSLVLAINLVPTTTIMVLLGLFGRRGLHSS